MKDEPFVQADHSVFVGVIPAPNVSIRTFKTVTVELCVEASEQEGAVNVVALLYPCSPLLSDDPHVLVWCQRH